MRLIRRSESRRIQAYAEVKYYILPFASEINDVEVNDVNEVQPTRNANTR